MENESSLYIFIPDIIKFEYPGYVSGIFRSSEKTQTCYITSDEVSRDFFDGCVCSVSTPKSQSDTEKILLRLHHKNGKISVLSENFTDHQITLVMYDYHKFKRLDDDLMCENYGVHFKTLVDELKAPHKTTAEKRRKNILTHVILWLLSLSIPEDVKRALKKVLSCSAVYLHFEESVTTLKWTLNATLLNKVSLKLGNTVLAKVLDISLGVILINYFLKNEVYIAAILREVTEHIISNLKGLLLYLMGSPIGLKLNYSFNKSLGQFFFYHISLWRMFLQVLLPLFQSYFKHFVLLGIFGCSFQMAMFSDIISITTFHVYCIYVYAARLFSLQLKGLTSLWRLLIGRKYNPLRERVDTCQYSPNQLFIGTLGFTVLLFLLPTTVMYYTVFSMFRLVILLFDQMVKWIRFALTTIPLYVVLLWLTNSTSVAGAINIRLARNNEEITRITVRLDRLPFLYCVKKCFPENFQENRSIKHYFHSIVTGSLI